MERLTARMRFNDALPGELAAQVVTQFCDEHAERHLLAYVYGYLGEHDLLKVPTNCHEPGGSPGMREETGGCAGKRG